MPLEQGQIVRRVFDAFNRRDVDALLQLLHPDIVWDWSRSVGPEPGVLRGRDPVRAFLTSWWETFESFLEIEDVIEAGDSLVVPFMGRNRGRGSGVELEGGGALIWTVKDGRIESVVLYQGREEALEALGVQT